MKVSTVISAYNAENTIQKCLESVKWADEIILVNNSSTDKTVDLAKKFTSKIYNKPNHLMLNINKNFGFSKTEGDWILCLDSDEEVSEELSLEIEELVKSNPKEDGFWIPRKNFIFGKWIKHAGWYPDYQLRLFKKGKGKFEEKHVHEMVKVDGETSNLKADLIHYHYDSISQLIEKHYKIYAVNESEQLIKNGYEFKWKDAIRFPLNEFLSRFFAREGYKDGFHGLMLSMLMAFYHFIIFALIWEKQKFKEEENIFLEAEKELDKANKDVTYWFNHENLKSIKNPIKRGFVKIINKIS